MTDADWRRINAEAQDLLASVVLPDGYRLLGVRVDGAVWTPPAPARKVDPGSDWWRSFAILAALLCFTASVSAAAELGPDVLDELRDNAITAIAIYGALREWNKRKGR